jgi:hypothetical protein
LSVIPAGLAAYFILSAKNLFSAWKVSQIAAAQQQLHTLFLQESKLDTKAIRALFKVCDPIAKKALLARMDFQQLMVAKEVLGDRKLKLLLDGIDSPAIVSYRSLANLTLPLRESLRMEAQHDPALFAEVEKRLKDLNSPDSLAALAEILFPKASKAKDGESQIKGDPAVLPLYRELKSRKWPAQEFIKDVPALMALARSLNDQSMLKGLAHYALAHVDQYADFDLASMAEQNQRLQDYIKVRELGKNITRHNWQSTWDLANRLQLPQLKDHCYRLALVELRDLKKDPEANLEFALGVAGSSTKLLEEHLESKIALENLALLYAFAEKHQLRGLKERCHAFCCRQPEGIRRQIPWDFSSIPAEISDILYPHHANHVAAGTLVSLDQKTSLEYLGRLTRLLQQERARVLEERFNALGAVYHHFVNFRNVSTVSAIYVLHPPLGLVVAAIHSRWLLISVYNYVSAKVSVKWRLPRELAKIEALRQRLTAEYEKDGLVEPHALLEFEIQGDEGPLQRSLHMLRKSLLEQMNFQQLMSVRSLYRDKKFSHLIQGVRGESAMLSRFILDAGKLSYELLERELRTERVQDAVKNNPFFAEALRQTVRKVDDVRTQVLVQALCFPLVDTSPAKNDRQITIRTPKGDCASSYALLCRNNPTFKAFLTQGTDFKDDVLTLKEVSDFPSFERYIAILNGKPCDLQAEQIEPLIEVAHLYSDTRVIPGCANYILANRYLFDEESLVNIVSLDLNGMDALRSYLEQDFLGRKITPDNAEKFLQFGLSLQSAQLQEKARASATVVVQS